MADDWKKLVRLAGFLGGTRDKGLTLGGTPELQLELFVDVAFAVHSDGKSHTGWFFTMGRGCMGASSTVQQLVTKSSSEAELVGTSEGLPLGLWARNFLQEQGHDQGPLTLYQDNMSTMAMIRNGRATAKRTRHINVRFFWASDCVSRGEVRVEHKPTKEMVADVLSKPVQGALQKDLAGRLLGEQKSTQPCSAGAC